MKRFSTWFASILIASVLLLNGVRNASALPPNSENGQRTTKAHKQGTTSESNASPQACPSVTVVLKEIPAPEAKQITAVIQQQPYKHWWDSPNAPAWAIFFLTIPYVLVSILAFVVAGRAANAAQSSADAAKKSADTAFDNAEAAKQQVAILKDTLLETRKSADAAVAISAAYPYLTEIWLGDKDRPQDIMRDMRVAGPDLGYVMWNFGKTPAFLIDVCWEHAFGLELPEVPQYRNIAEVIALEIIPAETKTGIITAKWMDLFGKLLIEDNVAYVRRMETRLYVYGYFRYRDVFERVFRVGFVYIVDVKTGKMIPANPDTVPGYIYRREDA